MIAIVAPAPAHSPRHLAALKAVATRRANMAKQAEPSSPFPPTGDDPVSIHTLSANGMVIARALLTSDQATHLNQVLSAHRQSMTWAAL